MLEQTLSAFSEDFLSHIKAAASCSNTAFESVICNCKRHMFSQNTLFVALTEAVHPRAMWHATVITREGIYNTTAKILLTSAVQMEINVGHWLTWFC